MAYAVAVLHVAAMVTASVSQPAFVKDPPPGVVLVLTALELAAAVCYVDWQFKQRKAAAVRVGALLNTATKWLDAPLQARDLEPTKVDDGYMWPRAVASEFAEVEQRVEADVRWPEIITLGTMLGASIFLTLVVCNCL
jgi:hypothetical protein